MTDFVRIEPYGDLKGFPEPHTPEMLARDFEAIGPILPPMFRDAREMPVEAMAWAQGFCRTGRPLSLVLVGPTGAGKSYAAAAAARYLSVILPSGMLSFLFDGVSRAIQRIQGAQFEDRAELVDEMVRAEVLVLDDLCRGKLTDAAAELLTMIVDSRQLNLRPTIATSNLRPEHARDQLPEQLYSRLFVGGRVVPMVSLDRRSGHTPDFPMTIHDWASDLVPAEGTQG